jgi:outer membrane receptor protein involved in Fe transport
VAFLITSGVAVANSASGKDEDGRLLQEIVVTAQKREERLQDVPIPVTAIDAASLVESGALHVEDYQTRIPGLRVTPTTGFGQILSIRGITTGGAGGNPTVAITVDDVPVGSSTSIGLGLVIPDLDPNDLARIEVLRGPQGSLYGASSMGGLIKFVTVDPSTERVSGRMEVGTSTVSNGDGPGYNLRASVNVPLSDTFAIQASGFTREDPGYIDNPQLNDEGVNEQRASGGRLAAFWRPSDTWSLKVSALYQRFDSDGTNAVEEGLGDLQQGWLRGSGQSHAKTQVYSATLNGTLGGVQLAAVSGYNIRDAEDGIDFTSFFGSFAEDTYGVGGVSLITSGRTKKFTQEVRLSAPIGERFDWLLGGFYAHEDSTYRQDGFAIDPASGAVAGDGYISTSPTRYSEFAAFADLTLHVTDRFDLQFGGRWSDVRQTYLPGGFLAPFFGVTELNSGPTEHTSSNPTTYMVTPRLKLSDDLMVYARLASGYRPGGINGDATDTLNPAGCVAQGIPCDFSPDKTRTYELGVKGNFLDRTLSLEASLYSIDWTNMQVFVVAPSGFGYNSNASKARSRGLELSGESRPLSGMQIAAWIAWGEAELTKDFPEGATVYGVSGGKLPYGARFSGTLSLEQQFPLGSLTGFVGGSVSYVGARPGLFAGSALDAREDLPAYASTDLLAGAFHGPWKVNLSISNLFDRRGVLDRGADITPAGILYIQPRTAALSVSRTF